MAVRKISMRRKPQNISKRMRHTKTYPLRSGTPSKRRADGSRTTRGGNVATRRFTPRRSGELDIEIGHDRVDTQYLGGSLLRRHFFRITGDMSGESDDFVLNANANRGGVNTRFAGEFLLDVSSKLYVRFHLSAVPPRLLAFTLHVYSVINEIETGFRIGSDEDLQTILSERVREEFEATRIVVK